ncbi:MAG TPA: peptidase E [Verrucomicrobiae bacterium]|nr:peptidase E [Verrucomicrobiae bacterium]
MSADGRRHILATSGGFARDPAGRLRPAALFDHALALTGRERPRVCLLATAQGDAPAALAALYGALAERDLRPSHLALHPMPSVDDPRRHLLQQDLIWVDGGSVANLLAVWRVHRLDAALREAWDAGVVLAGVSAGALCWFQAGTTDSFGPELRAVHDGLGFLEGSFSPHYDKELRRRPTHQGLVQTGAIPAGWAADDGVGLHFVDQQMQEALSERPDSPARGWRIERRPDGSLDERPIIPRPLGEVV